MNRLSRIIIVALTTIGLHSCSDKPTEPQLKPIAPNTFTITKDANAFSDKLFADGEQIGLYVVQRPDAATSASLRPSGNLFDNKQFVCNGGAMNAIIDEPYPSTATWVDMYGYAPYSQSGTEAGSTQLLFTVQSDQTTSLTLSDLMWVSKTAIQTTTTAPSLVFSHKLSKIAVKLTAGVGVILDKPSVKVNNIKPTIKFDISTGVLTDAQGAAISISAKNIASTTDFHSIITPQQITVLTDFITITNGTKTYNYTLPSTKTFETGKVYTYEITVNVDELNVKISGSMNDWSTGDTTTGEAL